MSNSLVDDAKEFLIRPDRNSLRLSADAAIQACKQATGERLKIMGVEGGIWHSGFESLMDSLWSGQEGQLSAEELRNNNESAAEFIYSESKRFIEELNEMPNVFILTAKKIN